MGWAYILVPVDRTANGSSFPAFDPVRKAGAQTDSALFIDGVRVPGRRGRRHIPLRCARALLATHVA